MKAQQDQKHRRLDLTHEDAALLYQGFLTGGDVPEDQQRGPHKKDREVTRREANIILAFESVLEPDPTAADGFRVKSTLESTAIELSQPEYELLLKYFERTPFQTRLSARKMRVIGWLESIPLE